MVERSKEELLNEICGERGERERINEEGYCLPTYTRPKIKSVRQNESECKTERKGKRERETIVAAPDIESS